MKICPPIKIFCCSLALSAVYTSTVEMSLESSVLSLFWSSRSSPAAPVLVDVCALEITLLRSLLYSAIRLM